MEREEKLINILEERQEEAIRRIAYNNRDSVHSANSLSSTNSNSGSSYNSQNAGRGGPAVGPGGAGNGNHNQFLPTNRSAMVRSADLQHTSPVGWDKSYPLRPMGDPGLPPTEPPPMAPRTPSTMGLYKRNSTVIFIIMIQILHIHTVNDYRTIIGWFIRKSFVIFVYRKILIEFNGLSSGILRNVL